MDAEAVRLDEFDEIEWREVARKLKPDLTDEEFAQAWAGFVEMKRSKARH